MSDEQKLEKLKEILEPVINWYAKVLEDGEPDGSFLYDTTYEVFNDRLSSGDFQNIVEILLAPNQPTKADKD